MASALSLLCTILCTQRMRVGTSAIVVEPSELRTALGLLLCRHFTVSSCVVGYRWSHRHTVMGKVLVSRVECLRLERPAFSHAGDLVS